VQDTNSSGYILFFANQDTEKSVTRIESEKDVFVIRE